MYRYVYLKKWAQILQTFDAGECMHVGIETGLLKNNEVLMWCSPRVFSDFRNIALVPQFLIMLIWSLSLECIWTSGKMLPGW